VALINDGHEPGFNDPLIGREQAKPMDASRRYDSAIARIPKGIAQGSDLGRHFHAQR